MSDKTRTETRTELDAQTIEELRPACESHKRNNATRKIHSECGRPAEWIVRVVIEQCGHPHTALSCSAHLSLRLACPDASVYCPMCDASDQRRRILSVEPIGGAR